MPGDTFVVVATGECLTLAEVRMVAMARARRDDLRVMTVNDAVYPLWFSDVAYACDGAWWTFHRGLPGYAGYKVRLRHIEAGVDVNAVPFPDIDTVESSGPDGVDDRIGYVRTGMNSGYQAIQLARHLGARRIVLLGFDLRPGRGRWFGQHPRSIRKQPASYAGWIKRYERMAPLMAERGVLVLNGSRDSALSMFKAVDLAAELGHEA